MTVEEGQLNGMALCAGVGGLELGLQLALGERYRAVVYVERDAYAASVLVARMEDKTLGPAPIWDDLTTFDGEPWRDVVDLISAGYPCQPFSRMGRHGAHRDKRHLWPRISRIIEDVRPSYVFCENVNRHLSLGFEDVCGDLEEMGYATAAGLFSAKELGFPHLRERLFFLAYSGNERGRHVPTEATNARREVPTTRRADVSRVGNVSSRQSDDHLRTPSASLGVPPHADDWQGWDRVSRHLQPIILESSVRGMADVPSYRVDRLRAIGNGVVPDVAALAFRTLLAAHRDTTA